MGVPVTILRSIILKYISPYLLHYESLVIFFIKTGLVNRRRVTLDHAVSIVRHGALFVSSRFIVPRRASAVAVAVASGGRGNTEPRRRRGAMWLYWIFGCWPVWSFAVHVRRYAPWGRQRRGRKRTVTTDERGQGRRGSPRATVWEGGWGT